MKSIVCPVSKAGADKNTVRITGFLTALLVVLYAVTGSVLIPAFMAVDFFIRAYTEKKYSVLSFTAGKIADGLGLEKKRIDKAPKIFAARVGLLFSITMVVLSFIAPTASLVTGLILMVFALLESLFNFCVGCIVYTYLVLPLYRKKLFAND